MTNTYGDDEKKQKNKKYGKGETHILSFPHAELSTKISNIPPFSSFDPENFLSTRKNASCWCSGSVASQRRIHHNGTNLLIGEVDCKLSATIS
jgi:hypothetical protein